MGSRAKAQPRPEGGGRAAVLIQLRPAVVAATLTLAIAPYVGILWERIAPAPTYVNLSGEVFLDNQDTSEFIAADGWFLVLGLLVGIASAALGYWRCRSNLTVILSMSGAAVLGAFIAREVGEAFGPAPIAQTALTLADGETIRGSIEVASNGVLFGWAVGILLTYLSLVGGLERSTPGEEDPQPGWQQPGWQGSWGDAEPNGRRDTTSVRGAGLPGDVGSGQGRQVGQHDPFAAEQRELGP